MERYAKDSKGWSAVFTFYNGFMQYCKQNYEKNVLFSACVQGYVESLFGEWQRHLLKEPIATIRVPSKYNDLIRKLIERQFPTSNLTFCTSSDCFIIKYTDSSAEEMKNKIDVIFDKFKILQILD